MIDLTKITPTKVSKDLTGYITYVYGAPKTGKTTLASQMPKALLLAFEKGYNAIPGIMAQDITSWSEFKQVVRELKKDEIKEMFSAIVIDTVDIAAALCEKYTCGQLGIENIGDGGWSVNGWAKVKKEFEETMRNITLQGYALFFISHAKDKTFKRYDGTEYNQIVPSLSTAYNAIVENMADIIGYAHQVKTAEGTNVVRLTVRSLDDSVDAGCRFKYIEPEIDFTYEALSKALSDAIDKEAAEKDNQYVTNERIVTKVEELDFDALMATFNSIVEKLIANNTEEEFATNWSPKIVQITETYLGKGKKVNQCTREQVEQINMIVSDLQELVK